MKTTSANGVEGILCRSMNGQYFFRVYESIGQSIEFKDYDLQHSDLGITINDIDASLYELEDGNMTLDHNPETLFGIKK